MNTLVWKDGTGSWDVSNAHHRAEIGNVTYYVHEAFCSWSASPSWRAFLRVHTTRRRYQMGFGHHDTAEAAKQVCERHLADGCRVGGCPYRVRLS
jgi:hypothetical protein